jgi:ATP-dependent DNA ligase
LDGEAVVAMALLISRHCALRERPHGIILYAFDLLHLDVKDFRQQTLIERRASLKVIVIGNRCPVETF